MIVGLTMNFAQGFFEIFTPPDEFLDIYIKQIDTWVTKQVLVLLDKLLRSEVAILVKKVGFENLFTIWWVCISKDVGNKEGENVSEGSVANVDAQGIIVIGVKELDRWMGTNREVIPPA